MIAKREQWKAARKPRRPSFSFVASVDPTNANAALLLLGVACRDPYDYGTRDDYDRYKLENWAVEAALSRKRRPPLTSKALSDIRHCVLEPKAIAWPEPVEE